MLRRSLDQAKLGHTDKLDGFRQLDGFVRMPEKQHGPAAEFEKVMAHEQAIPASLEGRTVFDERRRRKRGQRELFPKA